KAAEVAPAGTVTLAGTEATDGLPLESVTTSPPAGAGAERVTVPVEVVPPTTVVGLSARPERVTPEADGVTVNVAEPVTWPKKADTVTAVVVVLGAVVTVKLAAVAPAGTRTLSGTPAAAGSLPESSTIAPPPGAGPLIVTVPVAETPPGTLA